MDSIPQLIPKDLSKIPPVAVSEAGIFLTGYDQDNPPRLVRVPLDDLAKQDDLGPTAWGSVTDKPAVIAAGANINDALDVLGLRETLYNEAAELVLNLNTFTAFDSAGDASVLFDFHQLQHTNGDCTVDWNFTSLYDANGSYLALEWTGRTMFDSAEVPSIDWENRNILDDSGMVSIDYTNRHLDDSGGFERVNWEFNTLSRSSGDTAVNWDSALLYDFGPLVSLDWANRYAYDGGEILSIDWENRYLIDGTGFAVIDWTSCAMFSPDAGTQLLDWRSGQLFDGSPALACSWATRELIDISGNLSMDWSQRLQLGPWRADSSTKSGAGAIDPNTTGIIKLTTTGVGQALTLANGSDGQELKIVHAVDGGSGILTPATKTGYTTITFNAAGDTVTLLYSTPNGWVITGSRGVTIA